MMDNQLDSYQVSLKALLRNPEGQILALKSISDAFFGGRYDLPGGRINGDEFSTPLVEILKREIREEIGDIKFIIKPAPIAVSRATLPRQKKVDEKDIRVMYLFFEVQYVSGDITISNEHEHYKWINPSKAQLNNYFASGLLEGLKTYLDLKMGELVSAGTDSYYAGLRL